MMKNKASILMALAFILLMAGTVQGAVIRWIGLATAPSSDINGSSEIATNRIVSYWKNYELLYTYKLLASDATKSVVLSFLNNNYPYSGNTIKYWNNIGHGSRYYIEMYDDNIYYYELDNRNGISTAKIVFINSCYSFKDPLKSYIVSNNPDYYIGGDQALPVGSSDECCADFWYYHIVKGYSVEYAMFLAAQDNGLIGYYDIWVG